MSCQNCTPSNYRKNAAENQPKNKISSLQKIKSIFRKLFKIFLAFIPELVLIGVIFLVLSALVWFVYHDVQENRANKEPFYPQNCKINYNAGRYTINASPKNSNQSDRIIGGAPTFKEAETIARDANCEKIKAITGDWYELPKDEK